MSSPVSARLRKQIKLRADDRCEYCRMHADDVFWPHEPDHIIAQKHGGATEAGNLALACFPCNRAKRTDIASVDPQSNTITRLFNPRSDDWDDHFRAHASGRIEPLSAIARATARLLQMNDPSLLQSRSELAKCGRWP